MAATNKSALAREIERRMAEMNIGQKALALRADLNETYVRDILSGRSKNPQVKKLSRLAEVLGTTAAHLLEVAAAPEGAELVQDPQELVLLYAFRALPDGEKQRLIDYVEFQIDRLGRSPVGKAV